MLHEAQSFVLVPSPQQHNYPHPLSAQQHRWKHHHCWKKTALFVGDSKDREFQIVIDEEYCGLDLQRLALTRMFAKADGII